MKYIFYIAALFSVSCVFPALAAAKSTADTTKVRIATKHSPAKTAKTIPATKPATGADNFKLYHSYSRELDLASAKNKVLCVTGNTLFDVLLKGIKEQKLKAYTELANPKTVTDEPFARPITYKQVLDGITDIVMVDKFDKDGNQVGTKKVVSPFNQDNLVAYRIKEVVYCNKQTGKAETQIIGIAPLRIIRLTNGDTIGSQPICWLKFKQCLPLLTAQKVSIPALNFNNMALSDFFLSRRFDSKITEESNPQGLRIKDYVKNTKDQDKEAARIEKTLADYKANPSKY